MVDETPGLKEDEKRVNSEETEEKCDLEPSSHSISEGSDEESSEDEDEFVIKSSRYPLCLHVPTGYEGRLGTLLASPDGRRIFVGTDTGDIRMFDLSTMNKALHPYRMKHAVDHQPITGMSLSSCGTYLLTVSTSSSMNIINVYNGKVEFETVKGDMYIKNSGNTYGHQHHVKQAAWHPFDSDRFASASQDGTIRLWHLQHKLHGIDQKLPQSVVMKMPDKRGRATGSVNKCNCVSWSLTTAKYILTGSNNGDVAVWDDRTDGFFSKPAFFISACHDSSSGGVMSIQMLPDEYTFVTRGGQDDPEEAVKIWDLRKLSGYGKAAEPIAVIKNVVPRVGGYLSPRFQLSFNGKYLSVVEGGDSKDAPGRIRVWETNAIERGVVASYPTDFWGNNRSPVDIQYCYDNNQVVALLDDGSMAFHINPKVSTKGAMRIRNFSPSSTWIWSGKKTNQPDVEHRAYVPKIDYIASGDVTDDVIVNPEDPTSLPIEYAIGVSGDIIKRPREEVIAMKKSRECAPQELETHTRNNPFKRMKPQDWENLYKKK